MKAPSNNNVEFTPVSTTSYPITAVLSAEPTENRFYHKRHSKTVIPYSVVVFTCISNWYRPAANTLMSNSQDEGMVDEAMNVSLDTNIILWRLVEFGTAITDKTADAVSTHGVTKLSSTVVMEEARYGGSNLTQAVHCTK